MEFHAIYPAQVGIGIVRGDKVLKMEGLGTHATHQKPEHHMDKLFRMEVNLNL